MASVQPGFTWTSTTPITASALNLTASPTVAIGAGEVTPADMAPSGIGYATGAGGAVTQLTSRTTGVILNKAVGAITLFTAAGSATAATFTVSNSLVVATDLIILNQKSGADKYELFVTNVTSGAFNITFFTTGGTTSEVVVFNFALIKGVIA